eukprot:g5564.t1
MVRLNELVLLAGLFAILATTVTLVCVFILPITITIGFCYFVVTFAIGSLSPNTIEDIALAKMQGISAAAKFATKHRTPLVIAFVLPLSLLFDTFFYLRTLFIVRTNSAPELHDQRVAAIQAQVQQWIDGGRQRRMSTARPGWLVISPKYMKYKDDLHKVAVDLYDVLEIDEEAM